MCAIAFYCTGNRYYLLLGIVVGVVDALPALGSSIILIPYAVWQFAQGQIKNAIIILVAYATCVLVR